jgi:hypothetical protein
VIVGDALAEGTFTCAMMAKTAIAHAVAKAKNAILCTLTLAPFSLACSPDNKANGYSVTFWI